MRSCEKQKTPPDFYVERRLMKPLIELDEPTSRSYQTHHTPLIATNQNW
jgi:hypothetical protein